MAEARAYTLLFLVATTVAITASIPPLLRIALVLLGILALKHAITEEEH
jgi:hypothetical protein